MPNHIQIILDTYPMDMDGHVETLSANHLFQVG